MTRLELYRTKTKPYHWKVLLFFILFSMVLTSGIFFFQYYWQKSIRIDTPVSDLGNKVVVHLPNGQEVFTYEKLIMKKNGKIYYKGERNTIDLTGGTVTYQNW